MTTGQFLVAAIKLIECRNHNHTDCEQCLEETARMIGLEGWNMMICEADNVEDALVEMVMFRDEGRGQ